MTPSQKADLKAACEAGDDVRIVTVALSIAAHAARERRPNEAVVIRSRVDEHLQAEEREREHKRMRLTVAAHIMPGLLAGAHDKEKLIGVCRRSIRVADMLMYANTTTPCRDWSWDFDHNSEGQS
jgi:hypothetical protein